MEFGNFRLLFACFILTLVVIVQLICIQRNLIKFSIEVNSKQILKSLKMFLNETKYNVDYKQ